MKPHRISSAADADGEYITRKINEADNLDSEAQSKTERAAALRIEAGQRLIDVKARCAHGTWMPWLEANDIAHSTAKRLMALAGYTEEQRVEVKKKAATTKAKKRAEKKAAPKTSWTWRDAISEFSGLGLRPMGTNQRIPLEKALGFKLDKQEFDEATARKIAAMAASLWGEDIELPESDKAKLQRATDKALADLQRGYTEAVEKRVEQRVSERLKALEELQADAQAVKTEFDNLSQAHHYGAMSREEFQLIRSCLHPDREATAERKAKAFDAFNRLESRLVRKG